MLCQILPVSQRKLESARVCLSQIELIRFSQRQSKKVSGSQSQPESATASQRKQESYQPSKSELFCAVIVIFLINKNAIKHVKNSINFDRRRQKYEHCSCFTIFFFKSLNFVQIQGVCLQVCSF